MRNERLEIILNDVYQFKDENGNVINTQKIVLEKKHDGKLKLESIKRVREYWSEYARIFIEIYDDEPNECVLTHLYTLESHRQKGYGKQALSEAESIAKKLGCHTAHLKVETCSWMHQWYLRCGYNWNKNADEGYTWLIKNCNTMATLTKKDLLEAIKDMPMEAEVEFYHYNIGYANVYKVHYNEELNKIELY